MESDDDFELLPPADPTPPPAHVRKLKRLKKAAHVAVDRRPSQLLDDGSPNSPSSLVCSLYPESQSSEGSGGLLLEEPRDEPSLDLELPPAPDDLQGASEFVGSDSACFDGDDEEFGSGTDGSRAKRVLEFDFAEERLDAQRGDGDGEAIGEGVEDQRSDLPEKRLNGTEVADGGIEDLNLKKRKKRKAEGGENCAAEDEKHQAHATNKRRAEKVWLLAPFSTEHNGIPL